METEVLRSPNELLEIKEEWNELLCDSAADTVFLTWEWVWSWIEIQPETPDLFVLVIRDTDRRLVALAPFYRATHRLLGIKKVTVLKVLGDSAAGAEYGNVIIRNGCDEAVIERMAELLASLKSEWHLILVQNVAKWSDSYDSLLKIFSDTRFAVRQRPRSFSSTDLPLKPDEFLQRASANRRQQIRRTCRKVFAKPELQVVEVKSSDKLEYYLQSLFDLHRQRWEVKGEAGAFEREQGLKAFYRKFSPRAQAQNWLSIFVLEQAGEPIAVQYGYRYKGAYLQLQEGWDAADKSGIGTALRMRAIEQLIADGIREYDFLGGHTEHKRRWQAVEREGCDVFVANRRPLSAIIQRAGFWPTGRYLRQAE